MLQDSSRGTEGGKSLHWTQTPAGRKKQSLRMKKNWKRGVFKGTAKKKNSGGHSVELHALARRLHRELREVNLGDATDLELYAHQLCRAILG
jgi:hypothetical protein